MKVLSFGSLNIDYTYEVDHIVQVKETLTSKSVRVSVGGKGLNQAIALSKAGCNCYLAGQRGKDGKFLEEACVDHGVNTDFVLEVDTLTGNAIIQVNDAGDNCILLYTGANRTLTKEMIDDVLSHFEKGDYIILQNEINLLNYIIEKASDKGMIVCLNPSPYDHFIDECDLSKVSYFFLNEVEGEMMSGTSDENEMLEILLQKYPNTHFVLTLGEKGSVYQDKKMKVSQEVIPTNVVDTTGAGDTFLGYFIAGISKGLEIKEIMQLASKASSITVSRKGAALSIPTIDEL